MRSDPASIYRAAVTSRELLRRHATDAWLAAALVASLVEIAVSDLPQSKPAIALLAVAWSTPLFLRRRLPLVAPLATTTIFAIGSFFLAGDMRAVAMPILTAITAGWLMGFGNDLRRAVLGLAGMYVGVQVTTAHFSDPNLGDIVFTSLLVGAPWLAGRAVRTRAAHAAELRLRASRLEAERETAAATAVVEERARIARELHDVVAHSISVMTIQAGAARMLLDEDPERAEEPLQRVEDTGRETLAEMRRLLGVLRRDMAHDGLEPRPTLEHVEALVEHYRRAGLDVGLDIEGRPRALPAGLDLAAYRIVQEALTNTLKHAGAARARVRLAYVPDGIEVEVVDDGARQPRPRVESRGGGHGLVGMRERVAIYSGRFAAGPRDGGGFRVSATFPLERGFA
jgi:signal transduction histidine kinase